MTSSFNFKLPIAFVKFLEKEKALDEYIDAVKISIKTNFSNFDTGLRITQSRLELDQTDANVKYVLKSHDYKLTYYLSVFKWEFSSKGFDYWCNIYENLKESRINSCINILDI